MVPHIQTRFHVPALLVIMCALSCTGLSPYVRTSQSVPLEHTHNLMGWSCSLAATKGISLISFPKGTEMFHFPRVRLHKPMYSAYDTCLIAGGFPIQKSPDHKGYLPPPRSFSQAITSFIASDCQGIHHMHLITWLYNPKQSLTHTMSVR